MNNTQPSNLATARRPEITRSTDYLAKDQRKMLDLQRKRLHYMELNQRKEFTALIDSKVYSNFEKSVDFCYKQCEIRNDNPLRSPLKELYGNTKDKKTEIDNRCLNNCLMKKVESFDMLVHYFFAKMKMQVETKEDFQQLYETPEKFKTKNII